MYGDGGVMAVSNSYIRDEDDTDEIALPLFWQQQQQQQQLSGASYSALERLFEYICEYAKGTYYTYYSVA